MSCNNKTKRYHKHKFDEIDTECMEDILDLAHRLMLSTYTERSSYVGKYDSCIFTAITCYQALEKAMSMVESFEWTRQAAIVISAARDILPENSLEKKMTTDILNTYTNAPKTKDRAKNLVLKFGKILEDASTAQIN